MQGERLNMQLVKRILGKWYDVPSVRVPFELIFVVLPVAFLIRTFGFGLYQVPTGSMETTLLVGERFFADKLTYWFRAPHRGEIIAFDNPRYPYSSNLLVNLWQRYVSFKVSNWTKRVIGIPGDTVKGVIEDGHPVLYVNGKRIDESAYINKYPLIRLYKVPPYEHNRFVNDRETEDRSYDPNLPLGEQVFYKIDPHLIVINPQTMEPQTILYPGTPHPQGEDIFEVILGKNQYWVMGDNRLGSMDSRDWGVLDGRLIHGRILFRIWSMDTTESWWFIDLIKNPLTFWKKIRWTRCAQLVY